MNEFIEDKYGKFGTEIRENFERGFEDFKIGFLLEEAEIVVVGPKKNLQPNVALIKIIKPSFGS